MVDHTLSIILLIAISAVSNVHLQVDICDSQLTCGDCIKADASCHWCSDPAYTKEKRCGTLDHHAKMKCGKRFIVEKENKMAVMADLEFNEGDDNGANSVQLKPQAINLTLSPFKPQTIKVHFRRFNHPVDLYYLMDLSYTMLDDKDTLESLGNQLATKMKQLTKIFRVGFGSFVDKVTLPYTSLLPAALKKPCNPRLKDGKFVDCVPPYLFKNHLNLTSETAKFTEEVNRSEISGNLDGPEGGLEALMQVMVCGSEVGWARNNNARRIVVFVTDSTSHIAGDGKLGGILVPNDEKCHMTDNEYTHGLHHDYPSVSQISYQAHKNNVIVIFAVTKEYSPVYLALSERIYGSRLARLEEDSSNIVDIITEEYKSISQSVTLDVKSADLDIFDIKFTNNCTKTSGSRDPKKCDKLNLDETVEYEVTITAKKCPNDGPAREQLIQIGPGLFNDIINITVKLDCDCDCEKSSQVAPPGAQCQNGGSYHCGICKCPEQYAGNQCECDLTKESDKVDGCLGDKNGSVLCSNRGDCKCGACLCTHSNKYGGEFCQLSKEDCPQHENQLCSGHGSCLGGRCTCHAPWTGLDCSCDMRETGCVKNGVTCNGQGECKCNKCSCNDNYQGPYCKTCADCNDCKQIAAILQSGDILEKKLTTSSDSLVTNITHHDTGFAELLAKKTCPPITDRDGCYVQFKYNYDEDGAVEGEDEEGMDYYDPSNLRPVKVMVSERACPASIVTPTNTVVSILAIGILSLIFWKIVTYFHDKGEYEKFLKEIQSQAWKNETNPLFQSPETEIRNPAYNPHEN